MNHLTQPAAKVSLSLYVKIITLGGVQKFGKLFGRADFKSVTFEAANNNNGSVRFEEPISHITSRGKSKLERRVLRKGVNNIEISWQKLVSKLKYI